MESLNAKRGYVYEFRYDNAKDTNTMYALVVSNNTRAADRVINVIILSTAFGNECVEIRSQIFGKLYANCGKVTFTERSYLVRELFRISDKHMEKIDRYILNSLGISTVDMQAENKIYKELYAELLERYLK